MELPTSTSSEVILSPIMMARATHNTHLADRVELVIRSGRKYSPKTQDEVLAYLGARFRAVLDIPASLSDLDAGKSLFRE